MMMVMIMMVLLIDARIKETAAAISLSACYLPDTAQSVFNALFHLNITTSSAFFLICKRKVIIVLTSKSCWES